MSDHPMTPTEIASRLSPAQKRALLWLPGDGTTKNLFASMNAASAPRRDVLTALERKGLIKAPGGVPHVLCASHEGLTVRAIVAAQEQSK